MTVDKNNAVIEYLLTCEDIDNSPLYFNLINAKNNTIQIITNAQDSTYTRPYIDGSIPKRYSCDLIAFKSISDAEFVKGTSVGTSYVHENVDELNDAQKILDWIQTQNELKNFPDFGDGNVIDSIETTTNEPRFNGIDNSINPPLAMYTISIIITYVDETKVIYNKE